jgi:monomeric sarcosine oxidase
MAHTHIEYDAIVIGGGPVGLATSLELGKQGKKVLVLERFEFLNERGSSAGVSRQFRIPYPDEYMVRMAKDSLTYWDKLEAEGNVSLLDKVGTLWFGDPNITSSEGNINAAKAAMDAQGVDYTDLTQSQLENDYHFKDLPSNYVGLFQKDGASIDFALTVSTLLDLNKNQENVTLKDHSNVTHIDRKNDMFWISVGREMYVGKKLVITPGPFINDLLSLLGFQVPVTYWQMASCYFKKTAEESPNYPTWFVFQPKDGDRPNDYYGFPEVAWDRPGYIRVAPTFVMKPLSDPSEASPIPNPEEVALTEKWVAEHMTGLNPVAEYTSNCLVALSNTPNKEFLLDFAPSFVPNNNDIVICAAGWVAKFIPMLGDILASMVINGEANYDISEFKIEYDRNIRVNTGLQADLETEVAIVGAGMSGLYSAYRLTESGKLTGDKVQIFDMGERICGRIESVKLPEMDVQGELGGMRYLTSQEIITTLIEDVFAENLPSINFPMGDSTYLLTYLRKQRLTQNTWEVYQRNNEKLVTNYQLNENTVGFNADQLFNKVFYDVLTADAWFMDNYKDKVSYDGKYDYEFQLTSRDWNDIKINLTYCFENSPYNGRKVYELGFWNLIKDQVSQEGYNFLSEAGGYYSNTINWNAAEAFPYMIGDFSANTEYKTIGYGFDCIGYELAKNYLKHEGSNIWLKNKLLTFDKMEADAKYKYRLTFYNLESQTNWYVYANSIVLAMPRRSLELLDQYNFFFDINERKKRGIHQDLNKNIRSVIMEPAYKILMGFDKPWWNSLGIDSGHSITDLPMRQCYYFGTDSKNQHSMFLGSYGDMSTETFWKSLSDDEVLFRPKLMNKMAMSPEEYDFLNSVQASQMMVDEVMNEVRELHGPGVEIPEPYVTWFRDWTDDPFGAGYHAWKAGYKVNEVMPFMRRPNPTENIHICGEAYSDLQGWIEGAFCEAEKMLEEHFELERPTWLDKDYYLGW